jgi:hypothetical protein
LMEGVLEISKIIFAGYKFPLSQSITRCIIYHIKQH